MPFITNPLKRRRTDDDFDDEASEKDYVYRMQAERYLVFKSQDPEKGRFDVIFEVEGKKIYANQFILTSVSETFDAWLSDRWTTKDEIIKIEPYSFDNFYQFLCFVYIGKCNVTAENVFQLTDMAEYYGIQCLKEYCGQFLSTEFNVITAENVDDMYDFAQKYSLPSFLDSIKTYVVRNCVATLQIDNFLTFQRDFVEFLCTNIDEKLREHLFLAVYNWVEHQIRHGTIVSSEEIVDIRESIKTEVFTFIHDVKFSKMSFEFLLNFVVEKGFILSSFVLYKFFLNNRKSCTTEVKFMNVFALAEKQAIKRQSLSSDDECLNLTDSIQHDLAEVLPHIKFYRIQKKCLVDTVVANGIFTVKKVENFYKTRVVIENGNKIITGVFSDEYRIRYAFEKSGINRNEIRQRTLKKLKFFNVKIDHPLIPSTVTKTYSVSWYLCLERDRSLSLKHISVLEKCDYLLAEMSSIDSDFQPSTIQPTHLTFTDAY